MLVNRDAMVRIRYNMDPVYVYLEFSTFSNKLSRARQMLFNGAFGTSTSGRVSSLKTSPDESRGNGTK